MMAAPRKGIEAGSRGGGEKRAWKKRRDILSRNLPSPKLGPSLEEKEIYFKSKFAESKIDARLDECKISLKKYQWFLSKLAAFKTNAGRLRPAGGFERKK